MVSWPRGPPAVVVVAAAGWGVGGLVFYLGAYMVRRQVINRDDDPGYGCTDYCVAGAEMAMLDLRLQQLAARNQHLRASSFRTCSSSRLQERSHVDALAASSSTRVARINNYCLHPVNMTPTPAYI